MAEFEARMAEFEARTTELKVRTAELEGPAAKLAAGTDELELAFFTTLFSLLLSRLFRRGWTSSVFFLFRLLKTPLRPAREDGPGRASVTDSDLLDESGASSLRDDFAPLPPGRDVSDSGSF